MPVKLIYASNAQQAAEGHTAHLTPSEAPPTLEANQQPEPLEGSPFWPELHPDTQQSLRDRGHGELVDQAGRIAPELSQAINKGFPIPPALKARTVYETYRVLMSGNPDQRLRAADIIRRMADQADKPNVLPDQLSVPAPQVQVNVQNNMPANNAPTGSPAAIAQASDVTVGELVDEMLSRSDVQDALDAGLPDPSSYGI